MATLAHLCPRCSRCWYCVLYLLFAYLPFHQAPFSFHSTIFPLLEPIARSFARLAPTIPGSAVRFARGTSISWRRDLDPACRTPVGFWEEEEKLEARKSKKKGEDLPGYKPLAKPVEEKEAAPAAAAAEHGHGHH